MTHFNKLAHNYHRIIFEFTDNEIMTAGFVKPGIKPSKLETIRMLQKIAENDLEKYGDEG